MRLPEHVHITDVGPRDGLQNEARQVSTAEKIALVESLAEAGVPCIEVTSFVHPKWVPQMADAEAVLAGIRRRPGIRYRALVPNLRGTERALACGVDELVYSVVATETYSKKNWNVSVDEGLAEVRRSVERVRQHPTPMRLAGCVGATFGCPYEGRVPEENVYHIVAALIDIGMDEISLADTTGMGNPLQVRRLVAALRDRWPAVTFSLHLHNTRGMGLANLMSGLQEGIDRFDASVGGIGGCPFAPHAAGNICTEDAVHMLHEMGIPTGIDLTMLLGSARLLSQTLGQTLPGLVHRAGACEWAPGQRGGAA